MAHVMGIDIGTSGTRALVCNEEGEILGAATAEHPSCFPRPGWSEQAPEDWWRTTVESVRGAIGRAGIDGREIQGIGLSGQMHGAVCLDGEGRALRPAILWNDQRTAEECDEITDAVGPDRLIEITCNPALTGFTAPKILWIRKHEPEVYERTRKILLPKDYIRFRLSGAFATEVSDASGTLLLDVPNRRWSDEILDKLRIDRDLLADCYESEEVSAQVSQSAAAELGLRPGTAIVGGGGDQAAGAVGNGIVRRGLVSATLGTSGVVFAHSDEVQTDPKGRVHTFCHAVRGKWHVMGVVLSAGGSFQWWRNEMAGKERAEAEKQGRDPYELLCEEAAKVGPGCEGLVFLPYLTGERTPHADPCARGGWIGLTARHTRAHLIRAMLEGITFGMRDSFEIIRGMGVPIEEVRVSGGGARSAFWRQMQADVYGRAVHTINAGEGPAYGAALLAAVGAGVFGSVQEACDATIREVSEDEPGPERVAVYERCYRVFRRLYPALKDEMHQLAELAGG